uniref:Elongation factor 1-beta n=1 Tax=Parastrongyloides trichosuri TaxID=131310 RepID=A0A0N4ZYC3_PARTI
MMSVEALLNEVTPFFPSVKGHQNKGEETSVFGKLKEAIIDAKKTISSVLHLSHTEDPIQSLVKSNEKLIKDVNELHNCVLNIFNKKSETEIISVEEGKEVTADDDDFDLFDSDDEDEDEAKKKITEERLKAYHAKKSVKPGPIAKSSIILDIKPWDDTTDLDAMEEKVKSIEQDGLVWGGCKKIPLAYGINKLQIICVIEDLKVSVDDLIEKITGDFEDYVQSVDIAAFNKI